MATNFFQDAVATRVPEEALDGDGFVGFFLKCLSALRDEKIIRRSPRGQEGADVYNSTCEVGSQEAS